MAGTTPNLGLYLPGGGSTGTYTPDEVADVDPINQNFVKVDTFAGQVGVQANQNRQFYGPGAAIASVSGMKLGDEYQESDGKKILWRYDGSNWVTNESGLFLIRPTTVVNGTINDDGTVSITNAVASVSVNGCFSPRFRKYRIDYAINLAAGASIQLRLRLAGVDEIAGNYGTEYITASGTGTPSAAVWATTQWNLMGSNASGVFGTIHLGNPATSGVKTAEFVTGQFSPAGITHGIGSNGTVGPTIFDGFSFLVNGSTFITAGASDNKIRIFGML